MLIDLILSFQMAIGYCMNHRTGRCMTINECHPTWKVFHTEAKDSWAFGLYNTCFKEGAEGRQVCHSQIEVVIDPVYVLSKI